MHLRLRLELTDPPASLPQFLSLRRAQPRQLAPIDQLLPPPAVDRLVTDLEPSRTGLPAATRSSACRRNSAGYPFRAMNDLPESSLEATRV
jgi:hypothetical protein